MLKVIRLGLIGDNIAASQAPKLHRLAGHLCGQKVTYDLLIPMKEGLAWDALFDRCAANGYVGINITLPYKEVATRLVTIDDSLVRAMRAINTVVFSAEGAKGFNTDYSGFIRAYKSSRGEKPTGRVCLIGAGGVGRAIGFGLVALGCKQIQIADKDRAKAEALAAALISAATDLEINIDSDQEKAAVGCDGLINATPMGMVGYGGTPLPISAMQGASWAFDAVYTPLETQFLHDARAIGLDVISGYELFFGQGVDAWKIFTGLPLDETALREALQRPE